MTPWCGCNTYSRTWNAQKVTTVPSRYPQSNSVFDWLSFDILSERDFVFSKKCSSIVMGSSACHRGEVEMLTSQNVNALKTRQDCSEVGSSAAKRAHSQFSQHLLFWVRRAAWSVASRDGRSRPWRRRRGGGWVRRDSGPCPAAPPDSAQTTATQITIIQAKYFLFCSGFAEKRKFFFCFRCNLHVTDANQRDTNTHWTDAAYLWRNWCVGCSKWCQDLQTTCDFCETFWAEPLCQSLFFFGTSPAVNFPTTTPMSQGWLTARAQHCSTYISATWLRCHGHVTIMWSFHVFSCFDWQAGSGTGGGGQVLGPWALLEQTVLWMGVGGVPWPGAVAQQQSPQHCVCAFAANVNGQQIRTRLRQAAASLWIQRG